MIGCFLTKLLLIKCLSGKGARVSLIRLYLTMPVLVKLVLITGLEMFLSVRRLGMFMVRIFLFL